MQGLHKRLCGVDEVSAQTVEEDERKMREAGWVFPEKEIVSEPERVDNEAAEEEEEQQRYFEKTMKEEGGGTRAEEVTEEMKKLGFGGYILLANFHFWLTWKWDSISHPCVLYLFFEDPSRALVPVGDEIYENTKVNVDSAFLKFQKRLELDPEQILRYVTMRLITYDQPAGSLFYMVPNPPLTCGWQLRAGRI